MQQRLDYGVFFTGGYVCSVWDEHVDSLRLTAADQLDLVSEHV